MEKIFSLIFNPFLNFFQNSLYLHRRWRCFLGLHFSNCSLAGFQVYNLMPTTTAKVTSSHTKNPSDVLSS